ncbi:hypothetical protein BC827DRAFT_646409 [Russula dissimulans]|nr:hypothetical protein BC827DRAFT_646409 [Russula dissimulans]
MLVSAEPLQNLLFDYPGADLILRSYDSHHFRVPKSYISISSPVLGELIRRALDSPDVLHAELLLPVVGLAERGAVLHSILTFIFPVTPLIPSSIEKTMELLSVAQKYQMDSVLGHIRGTIAQHDPLFARPETALHDYFLAQKYGLRQEALQAARTTLSHPMTIEDLVEKLDFIPGDSLRELWKYHHKVRTILASDLAVFRASCGCGTLTGLHSGCGEFGPSNIPHWLDDYIESIGEAPHLFDLIELNTAMVRHLRKDSRTYRCECASITSQTIRNFWAALRSVVHGSFDKAELALSLIQDREESEAHIRSFTHILEPVNVPDANLIIRSSDLVDFRIHKSVLAMASPFFTNLLSLPQPPDSEFVDGLPVLRMSEDAELLNSLLSMVYPIPPMTPDSYDKVLHLLAACQKYEMVSVQSSIRAGVNCGSFPAPVGAEVFCAYAIASSNRLEPEMESAARLTLEYPMTFEVLGDGLRLFEGWALRDLASYRKRCRDNLVMCLESFLGVYGFPGPSSIWVGCPEVMFGSHSWGQLPSCVLPVWLSQLLSRNNNLLKGQVFTHSFITPSRVSKEYVAALQTHLGCIFCLSVHAMKGSTFCTELENKLAEALDKVGTSSSSVRICKYLMIYLLAGMRWSWLALAFNSPKS